MPEIQMGLDFNAETKERNHAWFSLLEPKIVSDFWEFHAKYPQVYTLFHRYATEAKRAGRSRFGIGMIAERVRWYISVESTCTATEEFKINNNLRSCYARLLMIRHPEFEDLFELRSSKGKES